MFPQELALSLSSPGCLRHRHLVSRPAVPIQPSPPAAPPLSSVTPQAWITAAAASRISNLCRDQVHFTVNSSLGRVAAIQVRSSRHFTAPSSLLPVLQTFLHHHHHHHHLVHLNLLRPNPPSPHHPRHHLVLQFREPA
jgi:hypothetical protein